MSIGYQDEEYLPLRDVVFQTLRKEILMGTLKPGERLMEMHLADRLGVSRTPIREAMRMLEREGLVVMIPRRGAEVASITVKELRDVLEVRRSLDALAINLACDRITPQMLQALREACLEFEHLTLQRDVAEIAAADVRLHDIILQASDNNRLMQLVNNLAEQMYRYRMEYIKDDRNHPRLIEEHRHILDCIERKDKPEAERAAKRHIDNQEKSIIMKLEA